MTFWFTFDHIIGNNVGNFFPDILRPEHGDVQILMASYGFPPDDHKGSRDITYERQKSQVTDFPIQRE